MNIQPIFSDLRVNHKQMDFKIARVNWSLASTYPFSWQDGLLAAKWAGDGQTFRRQVGGQAAEAERVEAWQHLKSKVDLELSAVCGGEVSGDERSRRWRKHRLIYATNIYSLQTSVFTLR